MTPPREQRPCAGLSRRPTLRNGVHHVVLVRVPDRDGCGDHRALRVGRRGKRNDVATSELNRSPSRFKSTAATYNEPAVITVKQTLTGYFAGILSSPSSPWVVQVNSRPTYIVFVSASGLSHLSFIPRLPFSSPPSTPLPSPLTTSRRLRTSGGSNHCNPSLCTSDASCAYFGDHGTFKTTTLKLGTPLTSTNAPLVALMFTIDCSSVGAGQTSRWYLVNDMDAVL